MSHDAETIRHIGRESAIVYSGLSFIVENVSLTTQHRIHKYACMVRGGARVVAHLATAPCKIII